VLKQRKEEAQWMQENRGRRSGLQAEKCSSSSLVTFLKSKRLYIPEIPPMRRPAKETTPD
jgi:hypothetical protein